MAEIKDVGLDAILFVLKQIEQNTRRIAEAFEEEVAELKNPSGGN